ncbi:MAG: MBL fold metallo-hydrolase RNA specificity domain-containing protein [Micrococcales bacterium]
MGNEAANEPQIQFLGAAGTVTGSRFLLSHGNTRVLIDCGMFQGLKELRERNWDEFPVDPELIDAIVITHAHLDHSGFMPRLVKLGFAGSINLTEYTAKLAEVILRDSARIQTEDAEYAKKKNFSRHNPPMALYDENDVENTLELFVEQKFNQRTKVADSTYVTFHPSGHILGAAFLEVEFFGKRLLFTGDMGRQDHPLLVAPGQVPAGHFDAILTESTYGDREHAPTTGDFEQTIRDTVARHGSVLIPAFAVDRTEVILVRLREAMQSGKIPHIPIYADSPMALKALDFYRQAIDERSPEIRPAISDEWSGRDPFDPGTLVELFTPDQSKTINNPASPCIIISASGMGTGGRVVHHLHDMLPNPKHTVIMVGYQAIGTRGRALADGAEFVKMHGELVPVKAQIVQIESFSVHADSNELIEWLQTSSEAPGKLFVVHGEAGAAEVFSDRIHAQLGWATHVPHIGEKVRL